MKKTIFLIVSILFVLAVCLERCIGYFVGYVSNATSMYPDEAMANMTMLYGILFLVCCIVCIAVLIVIAFSSFDCFRPIVDRIAENLAHRKKERKDKKLASMQERVDALNEKMDKLK